MTRLIQERFEAKHLLLRQPRVTYELIMAIFNWEYLSFYTLDQTWFYREMLIIPLVVIVLWVLWLKVIRSALNDKHEEAMSIEEAYQQAIINDALSTDEEDAGDTTETKEGLNAPVTKEDLNAPNEPEDKKDI